MYLTVVELVQIEQWCKEDLAIIAHREKVFPGIDFVAGDKLLKGTCQRLLGKVKTELKGRRKYIRRIP